MKFKFLKVNWIFPSRALLKSVLSLFFLIILIKMWGYSSSPSFQVNLTGQEIDPTISETDFFISS